MNERLIQVRAKCDTKRRSPKLQILQAFLSYGIWQEMLKLWQDELFQEGVQKPEQADIKDDKRHKTM